MTALQLNAEFYRTMGIIAEDEAREEIRQGKGIRMLPGESLDDFLRRAG
ncbi:MAG: hypothetical protein J6W19_08870 [Prevotella sp.]|nr:hypothetical protein [Prevotella sp.]